MDRSPVSTACIAPTDTRGACFPTQEAHDTSCEDKEDRYRQEEEDSWYEIHGEASEEQDADDYIAWLSRQAA